MDAAAELQSRVDRQKLIQTAVVLAAGLNANMPAHARRLLLQKFNVKALECEVAAECAQLAADAMRDLLRLTSKV